MNKRREPDWDELSRISQRAEALKEAGQLDHAKWRALYAEAETACHGYIDFTEFLFRFAEDDWLEQLIHGPKPKRTRKPKRAA